MPPCLDLFTQGKVGHSLYLSFGFWGFVGCWLVLGFFFMLLRFFFSLCVPFMPALNTTKGTEQ